MNSFSTRALAAGAATIALSSPMSGAFAASALSAGGPAAAPVAPAAPAPNPQTRADLDASMRGEAFANLKYRLFAKQARREGLSSVARLFDRASRVELSEHFRQEAELDGLIGGDVANLRGAQKGEKHESTTMYPDFARQAKAAGDTNAATRFSEIARDEGVHGKAFAAAADALETGTGTIPAAPKANAIGVPAGAAQVRARQTLTNLDTAMHGEAFANAKYRLSGDNAENPAVARLFRGTAGVERDEHFASEARLAGLVGTTRQNLTNAVSGEENESGTMYPTFARRAQAAGDTAAADRFTHNAEDEAGHARQFRQALDQLG